MKKIIIYQQKVLFNILDELEDKLNLDFVEADHTNFSYILKNINKLSNHLNAYKDSHDSLGKTIRTVVNHYNKSSSEFKKIDKDVLKISGGNTQINFNTELIDKPHLDE